MKQILLFYAFLLFSLLANSQQKIEVEVGEKNMSKGQHTALTVFIPEANLKTVELSWKKYVTTRSFGEKIGNLASQIGNIFKSEDNQVRSNRLKVEKNGDEFYVRSITATTISDHTMDIYARMTELSNGCQFSAFFQFTDSVFINESNVDQERLENMKGYIRDFGVEAYKSVVDIQINDAKAEVSKQEGVMKDLEKATRKQENAIARYETDIQEYNSGIFETENDIIRLNDRITAKKADFAGLTKKTPEYDDAKKELRGLSKEKSKYFNKIKSMRSKIKSKEMDIKSAKGKISANEIQIIKQRKLIEDKNSIVDQLLQKREKIQ